MVLPAVASYIEGMMTLAIHDQRLAKPGPLNAALRDYDSVRRAIAFISEHWRTQPTIEAIADSAALTPDELHHLFRRWAGLTPKAFMQALTLDHAKALLRDSASVLDAALDSGLSGPGRLHDLFVTHEAMSPGEWKHGGNGMMLRYGFHPSPFGTAIVMATSRGLAGLAFADPGEEQAALADMKGRWPNATYVEDYLSTAPLAQRIFVPKLWRSDQPLRVVLIGTDFEVRVWETLLKIPMGKAVSYSDIANKISAPKASRGGSRSRQEPGIVRGALPSRARQGRQADRLSLGHHAQAGDPRLGSGPGERITRCVNSRCKIELRRHRCVRVQVVNDRHAGGELALQDALGRQLLQHHDQRTQGIAVRGNERALAAQHAGENLLDVIGQRAR